MENKIGPERQQNVIMSEPKKRLFKRTWWLFIACKINYSTQITHKILPKQLKLNLLKPPALISLQATWQKRSVLSDTSELHQPDPKSEFYKKNDHIT